MPLTLTLMTGTNTGSEIQAIRVQAAPRRTAAERMFFTGFACAMVAVATAGFLPSLVSTAARRAPVSILAAAHGSAFFAWLLIFLLQARLVAGGQIGTHKRVGIAAAGVAAFLIPLAYATCIAMVRRGYDLSGDLRVEHDPVYESVFPLGDLVIFAVLITAALLNRHRPEMHKRLILFANIVLMPAPLAHFIGHVSWLARLPAPIILVPISMFLAAAIAREFLMNRAVHPLTWAIAGGMLLSGPLRAGLIGRSAAWHAFVTWLARIGGS